MYHHDERTYGAAVDETARRFQAELDQTVAKGQASAGALIERIGHEIPRDTIRATNNLHIVQSGARMGIGDAHDAFPFAPLHAHALGQLADRTGIPSGYVTKLLERDDFGRALLAENLNRLLQHDEAKRLLVREVNGEVRGVLSDAYRRMDSRPIIEAFADACGEVGAVPVEGVGGDLRWEIKALLPMVFRPGREESEVVAFGLSISNSDYGCGAFSARLFCLRIWCTNYAKLEEALRQVHIGKRLGGTIEFSARTHELDTETMVSATRDITKRLLAPDRIRSTVEVIGRAMDAEVDTKSVLANFAKRGVLKGEIEKIEEALMAGDVRQLPAGKTAYRMSNALSWIAKSAPTVERRMELEQMAGEVLIKQAA